MRASQSWWTAPLARSVLARNLLALSILLLGTVLLSPPTPAFAGQASDGQLVFYPCTTCHPVTFDAAGKPSRPIPNDFTGHRIALEGHDRLGRGNEACLVCHDDPSRDPGKLKTVDGSLVDIKGDVSRVCYRCHEAKYREFVAGTHGRHETSCVAAGCHDPHTPQYIYAAALLPFQGTGFQFKVLPRRVPFKPFASPPPAPAVTTPTWYAVAAVLAYLLALVVAGGLIRTLVRGRQE